MGLPAGWTEVEEQPERRSLPEGWAEVGEDAAGAAEPEGHALGTFGVNALDSLSVVGVPTVLAAKDAIMGVETAKGTKEKWDDDPRWKEKGIIDRYRQNKAVLSRKMQASNEEEPLAAFGGQMTAALVPGPKGTFIARGAATGAAHGFLGGSADTAGGDVGGTLVDTALGAAGGAIGEGVGGALGRFTKYVGQKAGTRLERAIQERVGSIQGKFGKRNQEAVGGIRNLLNQRGLEDATVISGGVADRALNRIAQEFPGVTEDLLDKGASNARKAARGFARRQAWFGPSGVPDEMTIRQNVAKYLQNAGTGLIKSTAATAAGGALGAAAGAGIAKATGNDVGTGAMLGGAVGGASKLYAARKVAKSVWDHPVILNLMAQKLPFLGRRMQTMGGNTGATLGYLTALLGTARGRQVAKEAAAEAEAQGIPIPPEWRELEGLELDGEPATGGEL